MSTHSTKGPSAVSIAFWIVAIVGCICLGAWYEGLFDSPGDTDTTVAGPEDTARQATVEELRHAAQAQGVCYGWTLIDGFDILDLISVGSNVGDGFAVDRQPERCPRWVEIRATIYYTDRRSEATDSATVAIDSSSDMAGRLPTAAALHRFGLDEGAFVDHPGEAVLRAAVALPLLVHQAGLAIAVPPRVASTSAAPAPPLDRVGDDFWRNRWLPLVVAVVLIVLAGVGFVVGWLRRGEPRDEPEPPPTHSAVLNGALDADQVVRRTGVRTKVRGPRRRKARRS